MDLSQAAQIRKRQYIQSLKLEASGLRFKAGNRRLAAKEKMRQEEEWDRKAEQSQAAANRIQNKRNKLTLAIEKNIRKIATYEDIILECSSYVVDYSQERDESLKRIDEFKLTASLLDKTAKQCRREADHNAIIGLANRQIGFPCQGKLLAAEEKQKAAENLMLESHKAEEQAAKAKKEIARLKAKISGNAKAIQEFHVDKELCETKMAELGQELSWLKQEKANCECGARKLRSIANDFEEEVYSLEAQADKIDRKVQVLIEDVEVLEKELEQVNLG